MSDKITKELEAANQAIKELAQRITALENSRASSPVEGDRETLDRAKSFLDKWEPVSAADVTETATGN